MKKITKKFAIFIILFLFINVIYAEDDNLLETVERSARSWLQLTDHGKYAASWNKAAALLKTRESESAWIKNMQTIRAPLGPMKTRYIATAHSANSLPDAPDGEYVIMQFYTTYKNKVLALENVTIAKEQDGTWRVSEYFIK